MRYRTPADFRAALEARLNRDARERGLPVMRLRKMVSFERFLARVQNDGDARWILKGGFALQLRLGDRARTTRDIDLHGPADAAGLREAARLDLDDHFVFRVGEPERLDVGTDVFRFPLEARLAGRTFEKLRIDVGAGGPTVGPLAALGATGLLDFAELPRPSFRAVGLEQQFAEKLHAMTRRYEDRPSTRVHDLADMMLILDLGKLDCMALPKAVATIFEARATHPVPAALADPPDAWAAEYAALAAELSLPERSVGEAMSRLRDFWRRLEWPEK